MFLHNLFSFFVRSLLMSFLTFPIFLIFVFFFYIVILAEDLSVLLFLIYSKNCICFHFFLFIFFVVYISNFCFNFYYFLPMLVLCLGCHLSSFFTFYFSSKNCLYLLFTTCFKICMHVKWLITSHTYHFFMGRILEIYSLSYFHNTVQRY